MKEKILDCRGLVCPQPVIMTKNTLNSIDADIRLIVLVDNEASKENVKRFAESQGYELEIEGGRSDVGNDGDADNNKQSFKITIIKTGGSKSDKAYKGEGDDIKIMCDISPKHQSISTAIVFASDVMGKGDNSLGTTLIDAFCHTLIEIRPIPEVMIFYNKGVFLTVKGSSVIDVLQQFEKQGVRMLVCGSCLNFYNLGDRLAVGNISNMFEILEALNMAQKIIYP